MTEKKPKGFAAMDPERRRELASKGGKSTPSYKRGWSLNPSAAVKAGKKGGDANAARYKKGETNG